MCTVLKSMNMMVSTHQHLYSCAVALNNIAVSLLEQQCYEQAIATLTDSVSLLRSASRPEAMKDFKDYTSEEISRLYQRACYRYAKPHSDTLCESNFHFHVLSGHEDSSSSSLVEDETDSSSNEGTDTTSRSLFLFRIESFNSVELDSSMVLHNFGMAYLCLTEASRGTGGQGYAKLLKTAHKILRMALAVLENEENREETTCPLNVSIIILSSLVNLSAELGLEHDAKYFQWHVDNCTEERREIEQLLGGYRSNFAAAA